MNDLKIKKVDINSIIGAEYNPRILKEKQFNQLTDSIKRFGLVEPIIVNVNEERKNIIISGHQRTNVAKALGHKTIPIIEVNLSPEKEKELNVRMNKNGGEWDFDMLANGEFDIDFLKEIGFQDWELSLGEDELDFSVLDEENSEADLNDMEGGVRKGILIDFTVEDHKKALELTKFWRENEGDIGLMLIEKLKNEKDKL